MKRTKNIKECFHMKKKILSNSFVYFSSLTSYQLRSLQIELAAVSGQTKRGGKNRKIWSPQLGRDHDRTNLLGKHPFKGPSDPPLLCGSSRFF